MKKAICISLYEGNIRWWTKSFTIGKTYTVLKTEVEKNYFYIKGDDNVTWWCNADCFEIIN